MNNIEKYETVQRQLVLKPHDSDREIARECGVSPTFVGKVRRYLEGKGWPIQVEAREGRDGRRRKPRRSSQEVRLERRAKLLKRIEEVQKDVEQFWPNDPNRLEIEARELKPLMDELAKLDSAADAPGDSR